MKRSPTTFVALLAVAVTVGACDGSAESEDQGIATLTDDEVAGAVSDPEPEPTASSAEESLLTFSNCMREEGLDFPDIALDADGNPNLGQALRSVDPGEDDFRSAMDRCGEVLADAGFGGGGRARVADNVEIQDAFVEFSACIRDQGYDVGDLAFGPPAGGGNGNGGAADAAGQDGQPGGRVGVRGGLGNRAARLATQLGLDPDDPAVETAVSECESIIDEAFAAAGINQPNGG